MQTLPANESAYTLLRAHAARRPDAPMITVGEGTLTFAGFAAETEAMARALCGHGVQPGHTVGLVLPNSLEWYVLYWAVVRVGAVPVPLDPQSGEWELSGMLGLTEVDLCFAASHYRKNPILKSLLAARQARPTLKIIVAHGDSSSGDAPALRDFLRETEGTDARPVHEAVRREPLMLACTSGSTGNPKIIVVPHAGFVRAQWDMGQLLGFRATDRMLLAMPLYHQGGFGMGLQMTLAGGGVDYLEQFDPERFLATIERSQATVLQLTATTAKLLLNSPKVRRQGLQSVRLAYFAGEVLPDPLARQLYVDRGIRVVNVVGSSETGTMLVWDSLVDGNVDPNEFRALPFTDVKLVDEGTREVPEGRTGTILIHTDALLDRYFKNPRQTDRVMVWREGRRWFNTGDLGCRVASGRIRFVGRAKRIIKRGANLVHPEEVESFLLTHPRIGAVAVRSESHPLMGESIIAHIQSEPGLALSRTEVIGFCHGRLASYKIPDRIVIVDELPHDIGKIQYKYVKTSHPEEPPMPATDPITVNDLYEDFLFQTASPSVVLRCDGRAITLDELRAGVDTLTRTLGQSGIGPGALVGYTLPNCPEAFYLFLALARLGACAMPLFERIPDQAKAGLFVRAQVARVITTDANEPSLGGCVAQMGGKFPVTGIESLLAAAAAQGPTPLPAPPRDPALPMLLAASSGTTGTPKLVRMTQANVAASIQAAAAMAKAGPAMGTTGYDSAIAFPLSTAGITVCVGMLVAGVRQNFSRDVSPVTYLRQAMQNKAQCLAAPAAYFEAILSLPMLADFDLSSIVQVQSGMDFVTPSLLRRLRRKCPNLRSFSNGYGLIETSNIFMCCTGDIQPEAAFETSRMEIIAPGVRLEVRDETGKGVSPGEVGELFVTGLSVVSGYLGAPAGESETFADGWLRTGDVVRYEGDQVVTLLGRKKNIIKRGGRTVSPVVIETCLEKVPGIIDAAVVGVPHPLYGEMVHAFVVLRQGATADLREVMGVCRSELPSYMVPDRVSFLERLPRTGGAGKRDLEELKRLAVQDLAQVQGS